jgi:TonB family protein
MRVSALVILLAYAALIIQPKVGFAQDEPGVIAPLANARKVVNKVAPVYPQLARSMNLSGTVRVELLVQASGTIKSIDIKGGSPLLAQSAQSALRAWKWEKADHETTEVVVFHFKP